MDLNRPGNGSGTEMNTSISKLLVAGVGMTPYSVRMRARGYVRASNPKPYTNPWKPSSVVEMDSAKMRKAVDHKEHVDRYGDVEKQLREICEEMGFLQMLEKSWGDMVLEDVKPDVCRPLPAGRMTPPQFRAWVAEGMKAVVTKEDARRYLEHTDKLRLEYYANLPDCVFAAAVKQEPNAAQLRAYRAGAPERARIAKVKADIELAEALRVEYERSPQLYFQTRAEQDKEMDELNAEITKLYGSIGMVKVDPKSYVAAAKKRCW